jgi:hypothetical protein
MYLMDTLANAALLVRNAHLPDDPLLKIFPAIDQQLKGTPRFLLDENAIHTAVELTLGRPKVLLEAMRHLRVPYPRLWCEWPESGREKLRQTFGDQGYIGPDRPLPKRLGFLLECTDETGRRGMVTWIWTSPAHEELSEREFGGSFPNVAPISPFFDLDARLEQPSNRIAGFLRGNLCRLWQDNPVQLEALFDIWRTAQHAPSDWGNEYCALLHERGVLDLHLPNMWADVYGEYIIIWAILLMLTSSRKTVEYHAVDRSRINKLRRQRKQSLLWDHTEVTVYLGQQHVVGERRQPLGYQRKSPRVHLVSSYLNRRGDKHWVTVPFFRGSGDMIHRQINVRR